MAKKIKGRPEEVNMESFFGRDNINNPFYGTYPRGLKVPDRPEIVFPKSTYEPILGATIKGLEGLEGLSDSSPTGTLRVDSYPTNAEFFIIDEQGQEISFGKTTPAITITDVDIGTYNYILRRKGYQDYADNIEIKEGEICCVSVNLQESTKKEQCVTQPITGPTIPTSQPGFIVLPERTLTIIGIILALAAGIVIGFYLLKKKRD